MEALAKTVALVAAAQAGDRAATEALFLAYYPRVLRIAEVRLGCRLRRLFDPTDIAQSVFGRAYRGLPRFQDRGRGSFAAWLGEIVDATIRDKARWMGAAKRGPERGGGVPLTEGHPAGSSATPSRVAEKEEDLERLHRAIGTLTERERRAVELRKFLGLHGSEVAEALGVSGEAAKKVYQRALEKMRKGMRAVS